MSQGADEGKTLVQVTFRPEWVSDEVKGPSPTKTVNMHLAINSECMFESRGDDCTLCLCKVSTSASQGVDRACQNAARLMERLQDAVLGSLGDQCVAECYAPR